MTAPVARIEGLHVSLRRDGAQLPVLRGVDLEIAPGEILGLVGESGSGKSVLALSLMGLLPAPAHPQVTGSAWIGGVDMLHGARAEQRAIRRHGLGVIFQDPMRSLNPTMRVGRQITETTGDTGEAIRLLGRVGVADPQLRMRVFPHELSGGLRQRVMAAIALTGSPSLIIADEPTTALDVTVQAQVLELMKDLRDEFSCGILFITHDLAVAAQITDRIAVLYAGRVAEIGSTADILGQPSHPYTAGLLGARLSLATPRDQVLRTLPAEQGSATDRLNGCAYHTRCPLARAECSTQAPVLELLTPPGAVHQRACWQPADLVRSHTAAPGPSATRHPAAQHPHIGAAAAGAAAAGAAAAGPVVVAAGVRCDFVVRTGSGRRRVVQALRGVDLTVLPGEALSLVGESGSGKSTLLRILAGLTPSTGGSAQVRGAVQMVFQDAGSSLTPWLTVDQLLRERLSPLRLSRRDASARVGQALTAMGLPAQVASLRPGQLSGGQQQRVALARATILPPAVLLCDEPTSALDASLAASVLNLIRQMRADLGMAVVFVTHDVSVARLMGDRVGVMRGGELVEIGTTDQVLTDPQHEYTRTLLAAVPEIAVPLAAVPQIAAVPAEEGGR
jgi:peptide/nickel transport system ATP-binding protein